MGDGDVRRSLGRRLVMGKDARALAVLGVVIALVAWNRLTFDVWLARYDVVTYYLPWYTEVGQRLRDLDIPAWNPHQFSGVPLAADPQSGWAYLIVMAAFSLLPPLVAYKAMVVAQLVIAGLATYWLGRTLRLGPTGALVAATAYVTGPFLQWDTACCLPFAQLGTWLPLALIGVELSLRPLPWRERVAPLFVGGFAVSQMLAGWVGEGWIYAVLVVGLWGVARGITPPEGARLPVWRRSVRGGVAGGLTLAVGAAIGAAGILPRLAHNAETNLADGDYTRLGVRGLGNEPWDLGYLATQLTGMGMGYHQRAVGLGGAVIVLALIGIAFGWRRPATPCFALLTAAVLVLSLGWTPLHWLLYRIPRYEAIHEHDPWRVLALVAIGPALLAGVGVEVLAQRRIRPALLPLLLVPVCLILLVALTSGELDGVIGWSTLAAAGVTTVVAIGVTLARRGAGTRRHVDRLGSDDPRGSSPTRGIGLVSAVLLIAIVAQPTGLEVLGGELGWPTDTRWASTWEPNPNLESALAEEVRSTDPGGVGAFLAARESVVGPSRYLGYAGVGYPVGRRGEQTYMIRRFQPGVQAVLVNGRPIFLGLDDIQGYNPIQYRRYVELLDTINGQTQGYHTAFLLASGVTSPLLTLLNVRYVVVDRELPADREDVVALARGRTEVFRTDRAIVYESAPGSVAHAWIVHDVRSVDRADTLAVLSEPGFDLRRAALVEGPAPAVRQPTIGASERAEVVARTPESLTIAVSTTAPGLLVVSEIFAEGWEANVNGEPVDILATNHALQGVPISAGEHVVELRYRPISLTVGVWISALSIAAGLLVAVWRLWLALSRHASGSRLRRTATFSATTAGST